MPSAPRGHSPRQASGYKAQNVVRPQGVDPTLNSFVQDPDAQAIASDKLPIDILRELRLFYPSLG